MVCQDGKLFMTETNELISCSTSPGRGTEMSDRKCKSAGATDTQSRNTKGARWRRPTLALSIPLRGVSLSRSLRFRKYIYLKVCAHYTSANVIRAEN